MEILERIILYLPGQDIVKVEAVRGVVSDFVRCYLNLTFSRPRSIDYSETWLVICQHFSISGISSLLAWSKTLVISTI